MDRKTIGALLLATGLVVAACGGGTEATPSPEPSPAATLAPERSEAPGPAAASGSVSGALVLPEEASLPPDSIVVVRILDQSSPGADVVVAEQIIPAADAGASPIAFAVEYDPATIVAGDPYVLGAQVTDEAGTLIFTAFEPIAVITAGNPSEGVTVALVAVGV